MSTNKHYELLRKLAQQAKEYPELITRINGGYRLFNKYSVFPHRDEVLCVSNTNRVKKFTSIANAVAYASLDRYNKIVQAQEICRLDEQRARIRTNILILSARIEQAKNTELYQAKLGAAIALREHTDKQLAECRIRAKYYQNKGFSR